MKLTGPLNADVGRRLETPIRTLFDPLLTRPLTIDSLALFVEQEPGAPLRVHSQHPLGKISARPRGDRRRPVPVDRPFPDIGPLHLADASPAVR